MAKHLIGWSIVTTVFSVVSFGDLGFLALVTLPLAVLGALITFILFIKAIFAGPKDSWSWLAIFCAVVALLCAGALVNFAFFTDHGGYSSSSPGFGQGE